MAPSQLQVNGPVAGCGAHGTAQASRMALGVKSVVPRRARAGSVPWRAREASAGALGSAMTCTCPWRLSCLLQSLLRYATRNTLNTRKHSNTSANIPSSKHHKIRSFRAQRPPTPTGRGRTPAAARLPARGSARARSSAAPLPWSTARGTPGTSCGAWRRSAPMMGRIRWPTCCSGRYCCQTPEKIELKISTREFSEFHLLKISRTTGAHLISSLKSAMERGMRKLLE